MQSTYLFSDFSAKIFHFDNDNVNYGDGDDDDGGDGGDAADDDDGGVSDTLFVLKVPCQDSPGHHTLPYLIKMPHQFKSCCNHHRHRHHHRHHQWVCNGLVVSTAPSNEQ